MSVVSFGGGFIAVGSRYLAASNTQEVAIFNSADGLEWTRLPIDDVFRPSSLVRPEKIINTAAGLYIIARVSAAGQGSRVSWHSNDGLQWTRVADDHPVLGASQFPPHVLSAHGSWVTGENAPLSPSKRGKIWLVSSQGSWSEHSGPPGYIGPDPLTGSLLVGDSADYSPIGSFGGFSGRVFVGSRKPDGINVWKAAVWRSGYNRSLFGQ
jgi:hypothetical protein